MTLPYTLESTHLLLEGVPVNTGNFQLKGDSWNTGQQTTPVFLNKIMLVVATQFVDNCQSLLLYYRIECN
jgi:hypothetical protein